MGTLWAIAGLILLLAVGVLVTNWYLHRRAEAIMATAQLNVECVLLETADIIDDAYDNFMDSGALGFDESEPMPAHESVTDEDWFPFSEDR